MNQRLASIRRRIRQWLQIERAQGASVWAAIFWKLPRRVLGKLTLSIYHRVYRWLFLPVMKGQYQASLHDALDRASALPFVVIAVPGTLHYLVPCLTLAARHVPLVLVTNGLARWEERYLRERFPSIPVVHLHTLPGTMLRHGLVIDLIVKLADRDLALHDPDLYVFDPEVYAALAPAGPELAVVVWETVRN